jgi:hypothetical protein
MNFETHKYFYIMEELLRQLQQLTSRPGTRPQSENENTDGMGPPAPLEDPDHEPPEYGHSLLVFYDPVKDHHCRYYKEGKWVFTDPVSARAKARQVKALPSRMKLRIIPESYPEIIRMVDLTTFMVGLKDDLPPKYTIRGFTCRVQGPNPRLFRPPPEWEFWPSYDLVRFADMILDRRINHYGQAQKIVWYPMIIEEPRQFESIDRLVLRT